MKLFLAFLFILNLAHGAHGTPGPIPKNEIDDFLRKFRATMTAEKGSGGEAAAALILDEAEVKLLEKGMTSDQIGRLKSDTLFAMAAEGKEVQKQIQALDQVENFVARVETFGASNQAGVSSAWLDFARSQWPQHPEILEPFEEWIGRMEALHQISKPGFATLAEAALLLITMTGLEKTEPQAYSAAKERFVVPISSKIQSYVDINPPDSFTHRNHARQFGDLFKAASLTEESDVKEQLKSLWMARNKKGKFPLIDYVKQSYKDVHYAFHQNGFGKLIYYGSMFLALRAYLGVNSEFNIATAVAANGLLFLFLPALKTAVYYNSFYKSDDEVLKRKLRRLGQKIFCAEGLGSL